MLDKKQEYQEDYSDNEGTDPIIYGSIYFDRTSNMEIGHIYYLIIRLL